MKEKTIKDDVMYFTLFMCIAFSPLIITIFA